MLVLGVFSLSHRHPSRLRPAYEISSAGILFLKRHTIVSLRVPCKRISHPTAEGPINRPKNQAQFVAAQVRDTIIRIQRDWFGKALQISTFEYTLPVGKIQNRNSFWRRRINAATQLALNDKS